MQWAKPSKSWVCPFDSPPSSQEDWRLRRVLSTVGLSGGLVAPHRCLLFALDLGLFFPPPAGDNLSPCGVPRNQMALAISHGSSIIVPTACLPMSLSFIRFFVALPPCLSVWFPDAVQGCQPAPEAVMMELRMLSLLLHNHSLKLFFFWGGLPKSYHAFCQPLFSPGLLVFAHK